MCFENGWTPLIYLEMWQRFILSGCISVITLLTLLSNVALILSMFRTKQQNNTFCMLMLFLSMSDCLVACTTQTFTFTMIWKPKISCTFQITAQFFAILFCNLSFNIIMATALERIISINTNILKPNHFNISKKRVYMIGLTCVLLAFVSALMYTILTVKGMFSNFHSIVLIALLISLMTFFFLHTILFRRIYLHAQKVATVRDAMNRRISLTQNRPAYLYSTSKVIRRIVIAIFLAYVPNITLSLLWHYDTNVFNSEHISWLSFAVNLAYMLMYLNSTLNAVFFIMGNQHCKRYIKNLWHRDRVKNFTESK